MKRLFTRAAVMSAASALVLTTFAGTGSASAVDLTLPSLWQEYQDDFVMGTFGGWNSAQALYHYRTSSPANQLKLDSQIGSSNTNSLSRQTYLSTVADVQADPTLDEAQKADAIQKANEHVVLQPTTGANQAEGILKAIQEYNAANELPPEQRKVVRAHVLAWHGGQQPNYFFTNGFVYDAANPDWASPQTMLKRLDDYIHQMMVKYAPYQDVIYSWDVVNEPIDDFTGQIRNGEDYQPGQWGRIFRHPELDGDPDARLYAESAWVRQAFASARRWSNEVGAGWKLYLNDFQDSNKLYEPKMSQTIKMLKPIHDAGNIDGYGMQGRLAWAAPSIDQLRAQIEAGLTVADEISVSESDIRSDFEPNPDFDPTKPTYRVTEADGADPATQWPAFGSCSWDLRSAANGNTFDVCNSPVRRIPAWGTAANNELATSPEIMRKQADFAADWMDLLIEHKDKVVAYQWDGTSDTSTFNRTTGGHLWSGLAGNPEKYSFFAVIGAPAREKLRAAVAAIDPADEDQYSAVSWQRYLAARQAAEDLVDVRIYTLEGVNAVKDATATLQAAIGALSPAGASADQRALLQTVVALAGQYESAPDAWTPDTWGPFAAALGQARALLADPEASGPAVEAATTALTDALVGREAAVDTSALRELIAYVQDEVLAHPDRYLSAGIADLVEELARAQAVLAQPDLTDTDVLAAAQDLADAVASVVEKGDTTALAALVRVAGLLAPATYTPASWDVVASALAAAQQVVGLPEASVAQVQESYTALSQAVGGLVVQPSKAGLRTAIALGQAVVDQLDRYVPSSVAGLPAALNAARAVDADADATADEIAAARGDLVTAVGQARFLAVTTSLEAAVTTAEAVDTAALTPASVKELTGALTPAKGVLADPEATQERVDSTTSGLLSVVSHLVYATPAGGVVRSGAAGATAAPVGPAGAPVGLPVTSVSGDPAAGVTPGLVSEVLVTGADDAGAPDALAEAGASGAHARPTPAQAPLALGAAALLMLAGLAGPSLWRRRRGGQPVG